MIGCVSHASRRQCPQRRSRVHARRGYSLVEMLLAVAIFSSVVTAVAVAMKTMYQVDRQLKDTGAYEQVLPRLSLQLRADAHAASQVVILDPPDATAGQAVTFAQGDETVEYQAWKGRLVRIRRRGQEQLGREVYALGQTTTIHWRTIDAPSPLVELRIVQLRGEIAAKDAEQVDRLVAAIGIRRQHNGEGDADGSSE